MYQLTLVIWMKIERRVLYLGKEVPHRSIGTKVYLIATGFDHVGSVKDFKDPLFPGLHGSGLFLFSKDG